VAAARKAGTESRTIRPRRPGGRTAGFEESSGAGRGPWFSVGPPEGRGAMMSCVRGKARPSGPARQDSAMRQRIEPSTSRPERASSRPSENTPKSIALRVLPPIRPRRHPRSLQCSGSIGDEVNAVSGRRFRPVLGVPETEGALASSHGPAAKQPEARLREAAGKKKGCSRVGAGAAPDNPARED